MRCPRCHTEYAPGTRFCPADGEPLAADDTAADPLLGLLIDERYRVIERLGAGGMGTVYRARQLTVARDVAIKVLGSEAAQRPEVVRRFRVEARAISTLRHPHTLKLIDFGSLPDGRLYLVSELLQGEPLDVVLQRGPLSPARTLAVLRQTLEALAEAHAQGIVHRDLKPANLFIERIGTQEVAKVLDFGIARMLQDTTHTATGQVLGTPAYMSPEQARGDKVDAQTDLYSLGVVAYECLTGGQPFTGTTPYSVLMKHVYEDPVPLRRVVPDVAPELEALVVALMAKEPTARPPGAEAAAGLVRALEHRLRAGSDTEAHPLAEAPPEAPTEEMPQASAAGAAPADITRSLQTPAQRPRVPTVDAPPPAAPATMSGDAWPPPRSRGPVWFGLAAVVALAGGTWWYASGPAPASAPVVAAARPQVDPAPPDAALPQVDPAPPDAAPPPVDSAPPDAAPPPVDSAPPDAAPPPVDTALPSTGKLRPVRARISMPTPARVELTLTPRRAAYYVGDSIRVSGTPYDATGRPLPPLLLDWHLEPARVGQLEGNTLRFTAEGRAVLRACTSPEICSERKLLVLDGAPVP